MSADSLFELIREFSRKGEVTASEMDLLRAQAKDLDLSDEELSTLISDSIDEEKAKLAKIEEAQESKQKQEKEDRTIREENKKARSDAAERKRMDREEIQIKKAEKKKAFWNKYGTRIKIGSIVFLLVTITISTIGCVHHQDTIAKELAEQEEQVNYGA